MLEKTLPAALREPWRVVLVDYSDPHDIARWARSLRSPRLQIVTCAARNDATRRPIQSQARAWQAGVDALPPDEVDTIALGDPLWLVPRGIVSRLAARPAAEPWLVDGALVVLPAELARLYRACPGYVGAGAEVADLAARLAEGGRPARAAALGCRRLGRPPPLPAASARLLALRAGALGWPSPGPGPALRQGPG